MSWFHSRGVRIAVVSRKARECGRKSLGVEGSAVAHSRFRRRARIAPPQPMGTAMLAFYISRFRLQAPLAVEGLVAVAVVGLFFLIIFRGPAAGHSWWRRPYDRL